MPLREFQEILARNLWEPVRPGEGLAPRERVLLQRITGGRGYRLTSDVRRSWCEARAVKAARLTLSVLPTELRRDLVAKWVDSGGGAGAFFSVEAEGFLAFIAERLPEASHELSLCRMEMAIVRAAAAAPSFVPPDQVTLDVSTGTLRRGRAAAVVSLTADPGALVEALERGGPAPAILERPFVVLVAPGIAGLAMPATPDAIVLWRETAVPRPVASIAGAACRAAVAGLLGVGALELV